METSMGIYIGIDQALRKIGVCILRDNVPELVYIKTPKNLTGTPRLVYLNSALVEVLKPLEGSITHAALEAQSYGSIGDLDQLGQINGIVQLVLSLHGVAEPLKVPPATLKKFVTGNAQATKGLMRQGTQKLWNLDIDQDDLCDAHGLARIAQEYVEDISRIRFQLEALKGLRHGKKRKKRGKKCTLVL